MSKRSPNRPPSNRQVWILGAGFSQPLGGPLFEHVFSNAYLQLAESVARRECTSDQLRSLKVSTWRAATTVYAEGRKSGFWQNAEQFLQVANDALGDFENSPYRDVLGKWCDAAFRRNNLASLGSKFSDIDRSILSGENLDTPRIVKVVIDHRYMLQYILYGARELLAVQVSIFLFRTESLISKSERWRPFKHWMRQIRNGDAIVSFNYDEAVEYLARQVVSPNFLHCLLPDENPETGRPLLLKLHGSAGWETTRGSGEAQVTASNSHLSFLQSTEKQPFILAPGPEKFEKTFKSIIRDSSEGVIRNADEVHVIGYRFPETDMFAQELILSSLRSNTKNPRVTLVLGPDNSNPARKRAKALLESAAPGRVRVAEAYSQDYLLSYEARHRRAVSRTDFNEVFPRK
ncbi:hypothetical protein [Crateriforma spongiae]|uniref:hypothetical protein n=1 Tax=Crateriforma spongiae TaxID=2724528 RepID=UPI00144880DA|nr:hypothetical protein [Crateriforma spongiae]